MWECFDSFGVLLEPRVLNDKPNTTGFWILTSYDVDRRDPRQRMLMWRPSTSCHPGNTSSSPSWARAFSFLMFSFSWTTKCDGQLYTQLASTIFNIFHMLQIVFWFHIWKEKSCLICCLKKKKGTKWPSDWDEALKLWEKTHNLCQCTETRVCCPLCGLNVKYFLWRAMNTIFNALEDI